MRVQDTAPTVSTVSTGTPARLATMRAVVLEAFGPPDVLRVASLPVPQSGPGEVRVRVRAAGVQPFDTLVRQGPPPVPVAFPQQLGNEFAGTVDAVGEGVSGWAPGDEVIGWAFMRSQAEYVVTAASSLVVRPPAMPWPEAGALSSSGQTALQALAALALVPGETLLIQGAAGGVGTMATQLARAAGVRVIGTAREENHAHVARLGAVPVTSGEGLGERVRRLGPGRIDAALDAAGGRALPDAVDLVDDRRRVVTLVDFDQAARLGVRSVRAQLSHAQLSELVRLVAAGALHVHVRACYPLERIVAAHRDVGAGHGRGKVVVTLDGPT